MRYQECLRYLHMNANIHKKSLFGKDSFTNHVGFDTSVKYHAVKILLEYIYSSFKLLRCVGWSILKPVLPTQGFIFMFSEGVIRKYLDPLYHPEVLEVFSKCPDILFKVADSGYKYIAEPEWPSVIFQPSCRVQCLNVAASC